MADIDYLSMLVGMDPQTLLDTMYPYQNEQGVLEQEMALAGQMRQPGPEHSTPIGALLGGLGNAAGNIGGAVLQQRNLGQQRELGGRMQTDAADRMQMIIDALRRQKASEMEPDPMDPGEAYEPAEMMR